VCSVYGWTVDYCLEMPANQFFGMLDETLRIRARDYSEQCDIAAIPMCKADYYKAIKEKYVAIANGDHGISLDDLPDPLAPLPQEPLPAESAKVAVLSMFATARRGISGR